MSVTDADTIEVRFHPEAKKWFLRLVSPSDSYSYQPRHATKEAAEASALRMRANNMRNAVIKVVEP